MIGFSGGNGNGEVTLRSSNPNDPPIIDPKYMDHPFDRRAAIEAVRETLELFDIPSLAQDRLTYTAGPKGRTDEEILVSGVGPFAIARRSSVWKKPRLMSVTCRSGSLPLQQACGIHAEQSKWENLESQERAWTKILKSAG